MGLRVAARASHRFQRGVSLLESLVAFVVLAAGAAAVAQLQSRLGLAGEVARERSEAVRLGATAIEEMRSFTALDGPAGQRTYAAVVSGEWAVEAASSPALQGAFRIEQRVDGAAFAATKAASVVVRWTDRQGGEREVGLHSLVAGVAPVYSGALGLAGTAIPGAARGAAERAPTIPLTARRLGDGRSVWKPSERGTTALVFDDRSGAVVGRCDGISTATTTRDLGAADLARCEAGHWLLAAGTIRFTSSVPADAASARDMPLPASVAIVLRDGGDAAAPTCFSEARKTVSYSADGSTRIDDVGIDESPASIGVSRWDDSGDRFLAWHCIVTPRADGRWSGRIAVVPAGWAVGTSDPAHRVCRYLADTEAAPTDAGGDVVDVSTALPGRNFLVVRGSESCPGAAVRTAQQQP